MKRVARDTQLSIYLLSIYLSVCLSIHLSIYLSICLSQHAWRHLVLLRDPLGHAPAVVRAVLCEALPTRRREEAAEQQ